MNSHLNLPADLHELLQAWGLRFLDVGLGGRRFQWKPWAGPIPPPICSKLGLGPTGFVNNPSGEVGPLGRRWGIAHGNPGAMIRDPQIQSTVKS